MAHQKKKQQHQTRSNLTNGKCVVPVWRRVSKERKKNMCWMCNMSKMHKKNQWPTFNFDDSGYTKIQYRTTSCGNAIAAGQRGCRSERENHTKKRAIKIENNCSRMTSGHVIYVCANEIFGGLFESWLSITDGRHWYADVAFLGI